MVALQETVFRGESVFIYSRKLKGIFEGVVKDISSILLVTDSFKSYTGSVPKVGGVGDKVRKRDILLMEF